MAEKLPIKQIQEMTSNKLAKYIEEVTQTEICKDESYCKQVMQIFLLKPITCK